MTSLASGVSSRFEAGRTDGCCEGSRVRCGGGRAGMKRQFTAARAAAAGRRGGAPARSLVQPSHECVAALTDNTYKQSLSIQLVTCTFAY